MVPPEDSGVASAMLLNGFRFGRNPIQQDIQHNGDDAGDHHTAVQERL
jgi:hypothetical protein